jgi:hypothetical protein
MAHRPEALPGDLADVLRGLLAAVSPELFGTVPPAVALTISGESLAFSGSSGDHAGGAAHAHVPDPAGSSGPFLPQPSAGDRVTRRLAGSGKATVSLSGLVARVRRARDLTLAVLTTDVERVLGGARSTVHEGPYTISQELTALAVTAVETQMLGDASTARIMLHLEGAIELSRAPREGEPASSPAVPIGEATSSSPAELSP